MKGDSLTIAHVDSDMGFSGGEVQVFLLIEGLRQLGYHNVLICQPGSRCGEECARRGIETRMIRMRNYLDVNAVRQLARMIEGCVADLVHANTGRDTWLAGWAAYRLGIPAVTTRRMDRRVKRGPRTRLIYTKFFQRVGAISPGVVDCLRKGGVPEDRIVLIPEAADPRRTTPRTERNEMRASLKVKPDEVLIFGAGGLIRRKGFDVLLDALAALDPSARGRVQVRLAGSGPEHEPLEERARRAGLADRIRFLGRREDIGDLFGACDVFVMPSRREGLGVASLEAQAAGRPVVASRIGGLAYSVVDGETGFLVAPESPPELAAGLRKLIEDAALRERLGAAAQERALRSFSPERMVDEYVRVYREILEEKLPR
jgi:glycosyltransferase involved in cell wall biosynthesis